MLLLLLLLVAVLLLLRWRAGARLFVHSCCAHTHLQ
jgi:hypothetical protein